MIVKEDLQDIVKKMKTIYDNVNSIQFKNEEINRTIENMVKKDLEEEKKTKIMPAVYVY